MRESILVVRPAACSKPELRWKSWTKKRTRRAMRMYSAAQRMKAVETFARFGCSAADTIAELGYPTRHTLRNWWIGNPF